MLIIVGPSVVEGDGAFSFVSTVKNGIEGDNIKNTGEFSDVHFERL